MQRINVIISDGTVLNYDVACKDTIKDLRTHLFALDYRILQAEANVVVSASEKYKIKDEQVKVVDVLHTYQGVAIQFVAKEPSRLLPFQAPPVPLEIETSQQQPSEKHQGMPPPRLGSGNQPGFIGSGYRPGSMITYTSPTNMTDLRLTDLPLQDLNQLLSLNKIGFGRFIDENNKVQYSAKETFRYDLNIEQAKWAVNDISNSYCKRIDNLTELDKELTKEGIKPFEFSLKIPFINALSFEYRKKQVHSVIENEKRKYSCIEHYFPVGELRLDVIEQKTTPAMEEEIKYNHSPIIPAMAYKIKGSPISETTEKFKYSPIPAMAQEIESYFQNEKNFSCAGIQRFYREYGQYFMTRLVLGIKHVAEFKEENQQVTDKTSTEQKVGGKVALDFKGIGFGIGGVPENNSSSTTKNTKNNTVDEVVVIGGSNVQLFDVGKLAQSITKWRLWRVIEVKECRSIHQLLPEYARNRINLLFSQIAYQHQIWIGEVKFRELGRLNATPILKYEWSKSDAVCTHVKDIFQIVPLLGEFLLLVQKRRIDWLRVEPFLLNQFEVRDVHNRVMKLKNVIGCAVDSSRMLLYIIEDDWIYPYSLPDFQLQKPIAIATKHIPIHRYEYTVVKNLVLGCGRKGLFCLRLETGEHQLVMKGDFSQCEIVRLGDRLYLFGKQVTCIDIKSRNSVVVSEHSWTPGQGTSNGYEVWKCSRGALYQLRGSDVYQVVFQNGSVNTSKFYDKAPVCYMSGSLYIPEEQGKYLVSYPLYDKGAVEASNHRNQLMSRYASQVIERGGRYGGTYGQPTNMPSITSAPSAPWGYIPQNPTSNVQTYQEYNMQQGYQPKQASKTSTTIESSLYRSY